MTHARPSPVPARGRGPNVRVTYAVAAFALAALAAAPKPPPRPTLLLPRPADHVRWDRIALSPDGRRLAVLASESPPAVSPSETVLEVWDVRTGGRLFRGVQWRSNQPPAGLAFLPGGQQVVCLSGGTYGKPVDVRVVAADTGDLKVKYALPPGRGVVGAASPDGKLLAVGGPGVAAALHDMLTGKEVARFIGPERMPQPVVFDKGDVDIAALTENEVTSLAFSPDGKRLAVGTRGGWVSVWDLGRRERLWREPSQKSRSAVTTLAFSPDGSALAYTARRAFVRDARTGRLLSPPEGMFGSHVHYADGRTLALWT
jgi:WD40 repeat protein